ncbi:MAG: DUF2147 domain-containing protein [Devosia sp.]|nr:DUF2147 domain-containing protein [Devosia sp.]
MRARYVRLAAALVFAAIAQSAAAAPAPAVLAPAPLPPPAFDPSIPIEGVWLTEAKSEITVLPCPDDFCGAITKIVVPKDVYEQNKQAIDTMGATQFTDEMNKDPSLKGRPIMGLQILKLHPSSKPKIYDGEIYNPQDGNTYSGYVEVLGQDKIRLNGCILYNIICKGEDWTRVPQPPADATAPGTTAPADAATPQPGSFQ